MCICIGPGAYSIPNVKDTPAYAMPGKWRVVGSTDKKPGPGTYIIPGAFGAQQLSTKQSYEGTKLGNSKRQPLYGKRKNHYD